MANENSDSLKDRYDSLRERCEEQGNLDSLDKFTNSIENEWAISINMDSLAIYDFLTFGKYKNVYEVKEELAEELEKHGRLEIPIEEAIKRQQKKHYEPRRAFDRAAGSGEEFKYGALNVGGLGVGKYGELCVVLKREEVEQYSSLAFIKEDSLEYVDANMVNDQRLGDDIANKECVHLLVALKHEGDMGSTPDHELLSLVCCDEDCTEAITADDILKTHIGTVRMSKKYHKLQFDSLYKAYASELSDESERKEASIFWSVLKLLDEQGIEREVLDEDGD